MKDYQQKRMTTYVLPEAVYRQALWALKDLPRLKQRYEELEQAAASLHSLDFSEQVSSAGPGQVSDITGTQAVRLAFFGQKIDAMEKAFLDIPEKYREQLRGYLLYGLPVDDTAHRNTWRKWQQILIYHVAENLCLI